MPRVLVPACFMLLLVRVLHCQQSGLKTWREITWTGLVPCGSSTRKGVCRERGVGEWAHVLGGAPEFET